MQVYLEIILHPTEDVPKFYEAMEETLGVNKELVTEDCTEGHYGGTITVLHVEAKKNEAAKIVSRITGGLRRGEREGILEDIGSRLSDSGLYLRLDKQEFVQKRLALEEGGAVRVRVYTPVYVKRNAESEYRAVLAGRG